MRNLFLVAALMLAGTAGFAQPDLEDINLQKLVYSRYQFGFSYGPRVVQKAKVRYRGGPYRLDASVQPGLGGGITYHINVNEYFSVITGIHGNLSFRNYSVFIPRQDFQPPRPYDFNEDGGYTRTGDFYLSFPVLLEKRWFSKNKRIWNLTGGVAINQFPSGSSMYGVTHLMDDGNGNFVPVMEMEQEIGNRRNVWIDYQLSAGRSWILENKNIMKLNLTADFSTADIVNGEYRVIVPGKPDSFGDYTARYSYMGLTGTYIFTRAKKAIKKAGMERER